MPITTITHGRYRLPLWRMTPRWRWRVEDATCLTVLSFPHLNTAKDDSCKNKRRADERSDDDPRYSASRKSRSGTTCTSPCAISRSWRGRRCARRKYRWHGHCRWQFNADATRLDVRIDAAGVGGVDSAAGAKGAQTLQVALIATFTGFVRRCFNTAATERFRWI